VCYISDVDGKSIIRKRKGATIVTNTAMLNQFIEASGLKQSFIANRLGLSSYGFARKRDNQSEFTQSEIDALCEILKIDSIEDRFAIFFSQKVDAKST